MFCIRDFGTYIHFLKTRTIFQNMCMVIIYLFISLELYLNQKFVISFDELNERDFEELECHRHG